MRIAIVHDYLTQRGGAERVVLSMSKAFPSSPLYTSLYEPKATFPEFQNLDVRCLALNRVGLLRRNHRLGLPFLAWAFSQLKVSADLVICSSSGWAHGVKTEGRKVVYCYTPARWLYQSQVYLRPTNIVGRIGLSVVRQHLAEWDLRAAHSADLYLTLSTAVQTRIRQVYGVQAQILPPPYSIDPTGLQSAIEGIEPDYVLCVARLLPYKNVDALIEAFRMTPTIRLVVVGSGPEASQLRSRAPDNVRFVGVVDDGQLRWLYAQSAGIVSASFEDYGLTPLEASAFGKPAAVLRWGGFLDTVIEMETGVFFDRPTPIEIGEAISRLLTVKFDRKAILRHANDYTEENFVARLRIIADRMIGIESN
jgi:glycosyltransferase involved in cell wall biosynthesis